MSGEYHKHLKRSKMKKRKDLGAPFLGNFVVEALALVGFSPIKGAYKGLFCKPQERDTTKICP